MTTAKKSPEQEMGARIQAHIAASGMTFKSVHTRAGMTRDTLTRRLADPEALTIKEINRLAEALHVSVSDLLPDSFKASTAA